MSYPDYRLVYFLTDQELIDIHKASGGKLGNFNVNSFDDTEHARQFIFNYLCPHPVRHWYASLGHESGAAFMVGKTTRNIRKAMKPDLQEKCKSMFNRGPNYCLPVPGANGLKWEMFFNDEKSRILVLNEFMGSDKVGDMYPYHPEDEDLTISRSHDNGQTSGKSAPAPKKRPFPDYRLVYFLTDQELINIHKACGGTLGNFNVNSFDDTEHARQFIFNYLCPHPVRHWYASLGHESGAAFMVGKTTRNIRKAMKPDLQEKCKSMFNRGPNYCLPVPGANGLKWEMFFNDEKSRILVLNEFMGSDRVGDLYPYRPEGVDNAVAFEKACVPT
ncbi:hypothetical protein RHS04_08106 [Rhizoctonia solani]|uniref:Uncharacterized protein n=1 Tax=Rhizoctonia solani TaxID=456999 RepID=A0A8H7H2T0_9AGAM|nr:hypothetical protein RHS04_08106 [Rhizoctonia solani]